MTTNPPSETATSPEVMARLANVEEETAHIRLAVDKALRAALETVPSYSGNPWDYTVTEALEAAVESIGVPDWKLTATRGHGFRWQYEVDNEVTRSPWYFKTKDKAERDLARALMAYQRANSEG